jgi:trehalose 6-phosphate phosphatase
VISTMRRKVPHLSHHWPEVATRIRESPRVALFLDFDGTLVPIAPRPELVRVTPALLSILGLLASVPRLTVAIISGRRRAELKRFLRSRTITYLGLYGSEGNRKLNISASEKTALRGARLALLENLAEFPGAWIEPKQLSFSVHVSALSPAQQRRARQTTSRSVRPFLHSLHLFENIRDIEIMPRSLGDKGSAVRGLLSRPEYRRAFPIFFGDDFSDEPAFTAVRSGLSVLVGKPRPTSAQFQLRSPAEVTAALTQLNEELSTARPAS